MNNATSKTHETPTLDTVECHHCGELVADRPYPPPGDETAWMWEASRHRFGCAAILTRGGSRPSPVAPAFARGTEYPEGDPCWFMQPERSY
jgi:hypothetical protein